MVPTRQLVRKLFRIINRAKDVLRDEKGDFGLILATVLLFYIIIPMSLYMTEYTMLKLAKDKIEHAIVVSAAAALYNVSTQADLSDIQKQDVQNDFINYLKQNLQLDSNMMPANIPNVSKPITISEIQVYGAGDVPRLDPWGSEFDVPGIHVVVTTELKRNYMSDRFGSTVTVTIHKDVDVLDK